MAGKRKTSTEQQRDALIREIASEIMPLLSRLSFANCPYCGSRTLVAVLKAHSGIFIRCDGITLRPEEPGIRPEGMGSNLEGVCLYQACLPLTIEDEKPKVIPFSPKAVESANSELA